MPLTTPITLTSSDQRQSLTWCSHIWPSDADPTPALLHSTSTAPNASSVASRSASSDDELGDVGDDADDVASLVAQLGRGRRSTSVGVDVGDDRAHALVGEALDQRAADASRAPGDDRDLAGEILHATTFTRGLRVGHAVGRRVVVLHELDEVAVEVLHVRHGHRPPVEVRRLHHRLAAGGDRRVVERLHVVGVHVELPHRGAHVDGRVVVELLRELHPAPAVRRLQDRLLGRGMSVRLITGRPQTPFQNSMARSRSRTLMQYCPRIETTALPPLLAPLASVTYSTTERQGMPEWQIPPFCRRGNHVRALHDHLGRLPRRAAVRGVPAVPRRRSTSARSTTSSPSGTASRDEALEFNYDYITHWETDNEEGLRGAFDPEQRDKELDADGVAAEVIFADADAITGMESPPFGAGLSAGTIEDPELAFAGAHRAQPLPRRVLLARARTAGRHRASCRSPTTSSAASRRSSGSPARPASAGS